MLFAKLRNRHKIFLYWRHTKDIGESERREGSGTKMRDTQTCTITNERASMSSINETVQVIAKEKRIKLSTPGRIIKWVSLRGSWPLVRATRGMALSVEEVVIVGVAGVEELLSAMKRTKNGKGIVLISLELLLWYHIENRELR